MKKASPEPAVHSSLGLKALCQRLQDAGTCHILELGPARGCNIAFWSRYSPSIFIADLRGSLPLPTEAEDPDWSRILSLPSDRRYNVILAWDMLNYLDLGAISSLAGYLEKISLPGAILFSLVFDQKEMPREITVYRILDEGRLGYECIGSEMQPCPRHQPRAISAAMRPFRVANSFRLRNGAVEYLFCYEANPSA